MRTHVKVVGLIHIAWNLLGVLSALFAILLYFGAASALGLTAGGQGEPELGVGLFGFLAAFGALIGCAALIPCFPGFLAGFGVMGKRSWARWTLVVISVIYLFGPAFPLGIYSLWVLLNDKTEFLFKSGIASA